METLFLTTTGSKLYGMDGPESDTDLKGYCVPNMSAIIGLDKFDQKQESNDLEGKEKIESVIYGVEKFFRLCLKGNPTILELAFAERVPGMVITTTPYAEAMNKFVRENMIVKSIFPAYFGYFDQQLRKLQTKKYDESSVRLEMVEKYGYDVKFAAHAFRLGCQCIELLQGPADFSPALKGVTKEMTLGIRNGQMSYEACLMHLRFLKQDMQQAEAQCKLPETYDYKACKRFYFNFMCSYVEEKFYD